MRWHHDEVESDIKVSRIVANILGLAMMTAIDFPQGLEHLLFESKLEIPWRGLR